MFEDFFIWFLACLIRTSSLLMKILNFDLHFLKVITSSQIRFLLLKSRKALEIVFIFHKSCLKSSDRNLLRNIFMAQFYYKNIRFQPTKELLTRMNETMIPNHVKILWTSLKIKSHSSIWLPQADNRADLKDGPHEKLDAFPIPDRHVK